MIKLWLVPEILVFVREMSLKFDFGGRHACASIQSHFKESSTLFLNIILISLTTLQMIPNGMLMVGSTDPPPVYDITRSCKLV